MLLLVESGLDHAVPGLWNSEHLRVQPRSENIQGPMTAKEFKDIAS